MFCKLYHEKYNLIQTNSEILFIVRIDWKLTLFS